MYTCTSVNFADPDNGSVSIQDFKNSLCGPMSVKWRYMSIENPFIKIIQSRDSQWAIVLGEPVLYAGLVSRPLGDLMP